MRRRRIILAFGDVRVPLGVVAESHQGSKYYALPTKTGLHVSLHPTGRRHISDYHGYDRDLVDKVPPEHAQEALEQVRYHRELGDELLVYDTSAGSSGPSPSEDPNGDIILDILGPLRAVLSRPVLRVAVDDLDDYLATVQVDEVRLHERRRNLLVVGRRGANGWVLIAVPLGEPDFFGWFEGTRLAPIMMPYAEGLRHAIRLEASGDVESAAPLALAPHVEAPLTEELERLVENLVVHDFVPPKRAASQGEGPA